MAPTRTLCPRCLESFESRPGNDEQPLCPACIERQRLTVRSPSPDPDERRSPGEPPRPDDVEQPTGFWRRQMAEASEWCEGRLWWARLPLWLYFVYVLIRHTVVPGPYRSVFDSMNLGIHELGHAIFRPFGEFLGVAGGTITQCLAPMISVLVFHRQRDYFGIAVCCCWLATNLWGVAVYMADARSLSLPLVAPGMGLMPSGDGPIMHDWNVLLGNHGLLQYTTLLAGIVTIAAALSMLVGLAFGGWLLLRMATGEPATSRE